MSALGLNLLRFYANNPKHGQVPRLTDGIFDVLLPVIWVEQSDETRLRVNGRLRFLHDQNQQLVHIMDRTDEPVDLVKGLDLQIQQRLVGRPLNAVCHGHRSR